ncbi:efflux RND transporter periplasmic adaptor subunit [Bacteroides sp. OttesenSCG-928-E20]|nr:efflux RND transporter periplasmic adaptor subunit [Bacteroides sp. OttesenSCG-928-N06]MDL2299523.1 efflux RND transporter periplasmic adaptor subunit [Bacteroides sp. OttesenSCG-928-E20]MDL2304808.1 efflux RND transporter periplasmic adaptor subunit [Bacteroides sp. OttesenSCG-928-D19]
MNKKTLSGIVLIVLLAALGLWYFAGSTAKHQVSYKTVAVQRGSISNSVTATGTLEPVTQVEVGTQVSGIISKVYVDYNSEVKKGELIAELDKTNLLNELASKQSNLANAKTEYEYQLLNYNRMKTLHEKMLVSDTDYESAWYNYERAKNSYDISKNDLAKAQTNLGYATIYSPIDGVVLSRAVEEGQTVAASFSTPTLFTIANDLTDMQVIADVDEADIGGVKEGLRVSFTVDAFPNDTFEGVVTQLRQQATVTNNVVTYEVVVSANNPDLKLMPGLTANITIYTLEKNNVLSAPARALRFTPVPPIIGEKDVVEDVQAEHKLWTRQGNTFKAHAVEVGISNGISTEIVSGIAEGTVIVTDVVMGQMPGANMQQPPNGEQKESSPFMPSPPGGGRR